MIAQLWGKNPENYAKTVVDVKKWGFAGVDINMGCPDKTVVKNGCCSAFIQPKNREHAVAIIQAVKDAAGEDFPVSVKTRLGWNEVDFSWHELLLQQKLSMLTIHGRTRAEMSKVPANWDNIQRVRELRDRLSPTTKIVGNGDVRDRAHGAELAAKHGLDGIMIGRGIFADPFCFAAESPWETLPPREKISLFKQHVELHQQTYAKGERRFDPLKKFVKVYINGFDGAKELREKIMECTSAPQLVDVLDHAMATL